MKNKILFLVSLLFFGAAISSVSAFGVKSLTEDNFKKELKVLSLNTWHEGTTVKGGFDAIVDVILQSDADIVLLSEIRNYKEVLFTPHILEALKAKGKIFYGSSLKTDAVILSKFPIESTTSISSESLIKCMIRLNKKTSAAVYAAHLDYTHYACYLPRGYDGVNWKKLPEPILDTEKILKQNIDSQRDEEIALFVKDAQIERKKGNLVLLGGDFNEPSHLDWTAATKDLYDHNGVIISWHNSVTLKNSGFLDAYRVKYPDPVKNPGFTWPAYNTDVELSKLLWAKDADERDRIDFIYFYPNKKLSLTDTVIVGPTASIVKGKGVETQDGDTFLKPNGIWPSDHKGVLATFSIAD
ncbi:endonuclease/exonuclease/phosphatase family protein [Flavobacterium plurextorum]|uniref:endonuclease/exonuclease/phosphatase family protein n=1 Tax=Flavobacterium plurextorum TaxID=1114867 RepID=UPI000B5C052E|nr:endonuclease/exonuclease/phosphatase family protein [Flavobacterium plurextorum]